MTNGNLPPSGNANADMLWSLYISERDFIRHHEEQRVNASNILAAIAAGLIVAMGSVEMSAEVRLMISVLLMAIGLFGYLFCGKLYALIQLHALRSYEYLDALEAAMPGLDIGTHKASVKKQHKKRFPFFGRLPLNTVWALFHLLIFAAGVVFLLQSMGFISMDWLGNLQRDSA
ncbi:MAG: hypothetical protein R3B98_01635 [Hyphomonas sp.]